MTYLNLSAFEKKSEEYKSKLFGLFIEHMPVWLNDLQTHFDKKDWTQLANTAHTIKPNISLFGLESLKDDIIAIEESARTENKLEDLTDLINRTVDIGLLSVEELKAVI